MDKKLPKVFANKVTSNGNNERVFYGYDNVKDDFGVETLPRKNINQKINEIFNSSDYIYKADVIIKFDNESLVKRIIGRNGKYLITMDNELIPINDIVDIKKK